MPVIKRLAAEEKSGLEEKLLSILKICQKLNSERNLTDLLDLIAREATRLMEADRASIFVLDREAGELWSKVALGTEQILRFDAHLGIAGAALAGETIMVQDPLHDTRFYPGVDARTGYRTRNLLAVALRNLRGENIGAFEVLNKKRGTFTEEDEEIAKSLAAHAAIAIETAQMVGDLQRNRAVLLEENAQLWKEVERKFSTQSIIGTSDKIRRVLTLIEQVSDSSVNVLITGESGTGKELVAKAIHYNSSRAGCPLVALNCAALPESLVESELFGVEKGVATGVAPRVGKFEAANGGTLFLDEIGDLSLTAQAKILRVLQERVVEHVGGRQSLPVNVRLLAATNKDLKRAIRQGTFREDLYYRLEVIHIHMPALREIRQDIPLLANSFLTHYCREAGKEPMQLAPDALKCLTNYSWPGNVRELENEMKRLVVLVRRKAVIEQDLSEDIQTRGSQEVWTSTPQQSLRNTVAELEKRMIREALAACLRNQQRAARVLGLSRQGLIKKLKRYGIKPR